MKYLKKRRVWVGFVSMLLILSLVFSCVGCGDGEAKEPTVTGVSPSSGKVGETVNVTITGTNLEDASTVNFGSGITVDTFDVMSKTQITVTISIAATATTGSQTSQRAPRT